MDYAFKVTDTPTLDLKVSDCQIGIFRYRDLNSVAIEIEAPEETLKTIKVYKEGNKILIRKTDVSQSSNHIHIGDVYSGGTVTSNVNIGGRGMNISQRGGNTYINGSRGKVFVNGREIDLGDSPESQPVSIKIYMPSANLEADLIGDCRLASDFELQNAYILIQGSSKVGLRLKSLDLSSQGSGEVKALLNGGELEISSAGSTEVEVFGVWSSAKVNISGSSRISTNGECKGDYKASISGSGRVSHNGAVGGIVRKSVSGTGRINI